VQKIPPSYVRSEFLQGTESRLRPRQISCAYLRYEKIFNDGTELKFHPLNRKRDAIFLLRPVCMGQPMINSRVYLHQPKLCCRRLRSSLIVSLSPRTRS
jgi:hypothetical protein